MDENISLELESVLSELDKLNKIVAQKEQELKKVDYIYLKKIGSEDFELLINNYVFSLTLSDLFALLEQMQDNEVFSLLAKQMGTSKDYL
jgi:hypothetical protein